MKEDITILDFILGIETLLTIVTTQGNVSNEAIMAFEKLTRKFPLSVAENENPADKLSDYWKKKFSEMYPNEFLMWKMKR